MLTAAILAGGQARRLGGREKSTLAVGGTRIIDRQVAVLREVVDHLLIVASKPARYQALELPVVTDLLSGAGALGGIYTALMATPTPQMLIVACDMPFLRAPFLHQLAALGRDMDIAIPRTADGYQPLCASYSRSVADLIRRRIDAGTLKIQDLLAEVRAREIGPEELARFDPDGTLFFNVNTPEDFARAQELARGQRP